MTNKEKADHLSKAVGELDEDIIIEADSKRKLSAENKKSKKKNLIIPAVSAAACAAVISGIILGGIGGKPSVFDSPVYAETLAEAEYPEQASYPDESKALVNGEWNDEIWGSMYEPYQKQRQEKIDAYKSLDLNALTDFSEATVKQFLTGSEGENRVYSPANLYMALSILAEVTEGNTRGQILQLAGFDNIEDLRKQAAALWKYLYCDDGSGVILPANSLWLGLNADFNTDTINRLANDYFASVYRGDMADEKTVSAIKNWLNKQTDGLLEDAAESLVVDPETIMMICSTLNFKSKWDSPFNEENNDIKTFKGANGEKEAEFMNNYITGGQYFWGEDYAAVRLFMQGGAMWIILPDEGKTVDDVLNSDEYGEMISEPNKWENSKYLNINLSIPKFDVSSDLDLVDGLTKLGVTDVFDGNKADFSSLLKGGNNSGVSVGQVKHAARVKIDEEGCVAVAFTAMAANGGTRPPDDEVDFIADRPFAFMITSGSTVLFAGTVNNL